MLEKATASLF